MPITTLTSREFNQAPSRATKAALEGPVFITDRGQLAHVLLSIDEYQRLTSTSANVIDLLSVPGIEDIEFNPPRAAGITKVSDSL